MRTAPFFVKGIGGIKVVGEAPLAGATICLHGGPGGNCLSLYPFFPPEHVAGDWFFVDLPNHGRSESTGGDFSSATCIARLEAFAATLEGPLRVVGHSWGSNVALRWASAHPTRFKRFISISGGRDLETIVAHQTRVIATMPSALQKRMSQASQAIGKTRDYLSNLNYIETLDYWMRGNPGLQVYREKTLSFTPCPDANAGYLKDWLVPELTAERVHAQLVTLLHAAVPVLLIQGQDDRMGDASCAMAFGSEDTGATVLNIPRAGHCPFVDQPNLFFPAVHAFFTAHH